MSPFSRFLSIVSLASSVLISSALAVPLTTGTVDVKTGLSAITLDTGFSAVLSSSTIAVKKVIPGQYVAGRQLLRMPISGGAFDLDTIEGEMTHSGGFSLSNATVKVSLTDFVVSMPATGDLTTLPTVSALVTVNGALHGRVNLFQMDTTGVTAPFTLPSNKKIELKDLSLKLTTEGAAELNTAFTSSAFVAGNPVGKVTVTAISARGTL